MKRAAQTKGEKLNEAGNNSDAQTDAKLERELSVVHLRNHIFILLLLLLPSPKKSLKCNDNGDNVN